VETELVSKESIRHNWQSFYNELEKLKESLSISEKEVIPIVKISDAAFMHKVLAEKIKSQTLNKVGSCDIHQAMLIIGNRIEGCSYGLKTGQLNSRTMQPVLASTQDVVENIMTEVSKKIDAVTFRTQIKIKAESEEKEERELTKEEVFRDFPSAMQNYLGKLQVKDIDPKATRDLHNMTSIIGRNQQDLEKMKDNFSVFGKDIKDYYIIVHGPIITTANLQSRKLDDADIDYDTVYFPGIRFSAKRAEINPRFYIFRNQLLIAIPTTAKQKPKKFRFKLKEKFQNKVEDENKKVKELVSEILSQYKTYIVVGNEKGFYSKSFPNIRFIWLMKKSQYNRIGSIDSNTENRLAF
jgi:hypothetical protein